MKRIIFFLSVFLVVGLTFPYLSNKKHIKSFSPLPYSTNFLINNSYENIALSISQDSTGLMFFSTRSGIWQFDGINWEFISTPGVPLKLHFNKHSGKIFVVCNNAIGYLQNNFFTFKFKKIFDFNIPLTDLKIIDAKQNIFIYTGTNIIKINTSKFTFKTYSPQNIDDKLGGIFRLNDTVFVFIKNKGFFALNPNGLSKIKSFDFPQNVNITFFAKFKNKILFTTDNDSVYIFNGRKLENFFANKQNYLKNTFIISGLDLNQNYFLLNTAKNGAIIIDKNSRQFVKLFNNGNGLPDNEIYDVFLDKDSNLWFSHNFGLTRFDFSIPLQSYNFIGLEGRVLSSLYHDSILYVITTNGAFYLTKAKSIAEIKTISQKVKQIIKEQKNISPKNATSPSSPALQHTQENVTQEEQENDNNFFKKLGKFFKRKRKKQKQTLNETPPQQDTTSNPPVQTANIDTLNNPQTTQNTKVIYKKITIRKKVEKNTFPFYYFKKIDDIKEKCIAIFHYRNKAYITTNNGIYLIENKKVKKIYKNFISNIFPAQNKNGFFITDKEGILFIDISNLNNPSASRLIFYKQINDNFNSVFDTDSAIWIGGDGVAYKISVDKALNIKSIHEYPLSQDFLDPVKIIYSKPSNRLLFVYASGISKYLPEIDKIVKIKSYNYQKYGKVRFITSQPGFLWIKTSKNWSYITTDTSLILDSAFFKALKIFDNINDLKIDENKNIWIVDNYKSIYKLTSGKKSYLQKNFRLFISKIVINDTNILKTNKLNLSYKQSNNIKIFVLAPFFLKEKGVWFRYKISTKYQNAHWSQWQQSNLIELPPLTEGKYTITIQAKDIFGNLTKPQIIDINIKPPFYRTWWFSLLVIIFAISLTIFIFWLRTRSLEKQKQILEQKVKERTLQIQKQNEELKAKNEEIQKQRDEIKKQHEYITQSINYARRIQNAILPAEELLSSFFSEYFIISLPRDIVSGDFYWFKKINDSKIILTVADCTGHGVPGAFLSMLGTAYLNEIVNYPDITAGQILNILRENIIISLQEREDNDIRDGMDIALAIFDFKNHKVNYAGAYNPLFIFREGELIEIKGDRMPVGFSRKNHIPFKDNWFDFQENDTFYLFSDGFIDQFGGKYHRKFRMVNFKKLLSSIQDAPLEIQKELIVSAYKEWKGDNKQIDDITIVGVKV